ncbi:MAG: T9SS type A sorting domain-containing protein [Bacteroidetes bacterium]|nr:T9SS type A sorting domain-containing protein [Bacteroidota bacterium]
MSHRSLSISLICLYVLLSITGPAAVQAQTLTGGNVLLLDGSGDYVAGPNLPNFGTGDFTIEAWIKTSGGTIFSNRNTDSYGSFVTFSAGAQLGVEICEDGSGTDYATPAGTASVSNNQWHHVAMTRSGTTIKFYVDGVLDNTVTTGLANIVTSELMYVGARGGGYFGIVDYFNGSMDDLRVWNVARTAMEISSNKDNYIDPGTSGLMLNYRFDESSGSTAADATSNDYDGTLYGNALFPSTPLPVELSSFAAAVEGRTVTLRWNTASEQNNLGFEIERRTAGEGAVMSEEWHNAGFAEGHGTSNAPRSYSFVDRTASPGHFRYRLKQVDRDGQFEYSKEVEVFVASVPARFELSQNYPNPFNPVTTIGFTLQQTGWTTLIVYNVVGQEVATLVREVRDAGVYHEVLFDAGDHASGLYFVRLVSSGNTLVRKIVLLK